MAALERKVDRYLGCVHGAASSLRARAFLGLSIDTSAGHGALRYCAHRHHFDDGGQRYPQDALDATTQQL